MAVTNCIILATMICLVYSELLELSENVIPDKSRRFHIDFEQNEFVKDGEVFRYVSGSLHYFRIPKAFWRDRMRKMRAAGLNALSTYVEWSSHEPYPRDYVFSGNLDLEYFLKLATEEDLLVLLRPGPYICAERDFGGLPPWLLGMNPKMSIRSSDEQYQKEVKLWFDKLMPKMTPFLYGNGGPIIMVQVENEYGSYFECDTEHMTWLGNLLQSYVGDTAVLYTTDGSSTSLLNCGSITGSNVYATVDFGTSANVNSSFEIMRKREPKGPLVNSEFYPGWLSHWENPLATVETKGIVEMAEKMLRLNASFNFYMFHGGTNFGFMAGANGFEANDYKAQLTSYDYDAPLDEAGDPTPKYYAIKNLLSKYTPMKNMLLPKRARKGDYGSVQMLPMISIFDTSVIPGTVVQKSQVPMSFEQLNQSYGFVLYETIVPAGISDPEILYVTELRDRAIVFLNQIPVSILSRGRSLYTAQLMAKPGQTLGLLVENQGRINFGRRLNDPKGILKMPMMGNQILGNWTMTGFPLHSVSWLDNIVERAEAVLPPAFYRGEFTLPADMEYPLDTFLDVTGWTKGVAFINDVNLGRYWPSTGLKLLFTFAQGVAFINDVNLGRYWPSTGPQVTLYVPGCYLLPYPKVNVIVLFELEHQAADLKLRFSTTPLLNMTPPSFVNRDADAKKKIFYEQTLMQGNTF